MDKIEEFYNKYKDESYPIPPHISKYCLYSATVILIGSITAFFCNYKILSLLLFCLYITSYIYWSKPALMSISKIIDHFFVLLVFVYVTYLSFNFTKKYRKLWISIFLFLVTVGIINQTILNFKIINVFKQSNHDHYVKGDDEREGLDNEKKFNYFTLDYTYPNTYERELAGFYCIIIHSCCIHIFPCLFGIYCIILNPA
jgi:hypothetical protein